MLRHVAVASFDGAAALVIENGLGLGCCCCRLCLFAHWLLLLRRSHRAVDVTLLLGRMVTDCSSDGKGQKIEGRVVERVGEEFIVIFVLVSSGDHRGFSL